MRNLALLIRKDFISALLSPGNLAMIALLFVCLVAMNPALVFVLVVYIMVVNLFAAEENDLVCNVTGILPVRMGQVVLARYLYAWSILLGTTVVGGILSGVLNTFVFHSNPDWLQSLLIALAAALIMISVIMPLNYRLGVMRARIASMVIYILMVVISTFVATMTRIEIPGAGSIVPLSSVALGSLLAGIVLSVISLFISLQIKKN